MSKHITTINDENEPLIAQYINRMVPQNYKPSTIQTQKKILEHAAKTIASNHHVSLLEASEQQFQAYVSQCSATTAKTKISIVKAFRRYHKKPLNDKDLYIVVHGDDSDPVPAPFPKDVAKIYRLDLNLVHSFLVTLLAETGVRVKKATSLNHEDFDLNLRLLTLEHTKGGKERIVPMSAILISKYLTAFKHLQTKSGKVFRFSDNQALKIVQKIGKRIGIRLSPHAFRKYFAVREYYNTKDLIHVQGLLGHSNAVTTSRYINSTYYKKYVAQMEQSQTSHVETAEQKEA